MRVRLGYAFLLIITFSLTSCIRLPLPGAEGTSASLPTRDAKPGLLRKRVAGKQDPNLLLAEDGTSCAVTANRYRDVAVGDHVVCVWQ